MKQREQRHQVVIPARVRWEGRWVPASIRNISSKGLMLRTTVPPPTGTYVEIQLGSGAITARSMWTLDQFCGLRSQDRLDVMALRGSRGSKADASAAAVRSAPSPMRRPTGRNAQEQAELSKRLSALVQFVTVVAVGVGAAGSLGWEVYQILSAPMAAIEHRMQ